VDVDAHLAKRDGALSVDFPDLVECDSRHVNMNS
jgi:hypothetical protein